MIPETRRALFDALDQALPFDLQDPDLIRDYLYKEALGIGQDVNHDLQVYVAMLIEEFCPAQPSNRPTA